MTQRYFDTTAKTAPTLRNTHHKRMKELAEGDLDPPLVSVLAAQADFSWSIFGNPDQRSNLGVIDHLKKELIELAAAPNDLSEWIDVIILGMDGAMRIPGVIPMQVAEALGAKIMRNMEREWPDLHKQVQGRAVEHVRTDAEKQAKADLLRTELPTDMPPLPINLNEVERWARQSGWGSAHLLLSSANKADDEKAVILASHAKAHGWDSPAEMVAAAHLHREHVRSVTESVAMSVTSPTRPAVNYTLLTDIATDQGFNTVEEMVLALLHADGRIGEGA